MALTATTDILFADEPDVDALREVVARAFMVDPILVAVGPLLSADPPANAQVVLQRQPEDVPGDFPVWYGLAVDSLLLSRVAGAIDTVAHDLGMAVISDAGEDEEMTLHLPDGMDRVVRLAQDGEDAFRITPEMRRLIDLAGHRASNAGKHPATLWRNRKATAS